MWYRIIIFGTIIALLSYFLGYSHCKTDNMHCKIKEIKNVNKQQQIIISQPNAVKSELLKLMHNGKL